MATAGPIRPSSSRENVQLMIRRYFIQLTEGCGVKGCHNPNCATGSGKPRGPNTAAATAVLLVQRKAKLCMPPTTDWKGSPLPKAAASGSGGGGDTVSKSSSHNSNNNDETDLGSVSSEPMDVAITASSSSSSYLSSTAPDPVLVTTSATSTSTTSAIAAGPSSLPLLSSSSDGGGGGDFGIGGGGGGVGLSSASSEPSSTVSSDHPMMLGSPVGVINPFVVDSGSEEVMETVGGGGGGGGSGVDAQHELKGVSQPIPLLQRDLETPCLTEKMVEDLLLKAKTSTPADYRELNRMLWMVFTHPESLNKSFLLPNGFPHEKENEQDNNPNNRITVDVPAVRRVYSSLFELEVDSIKNSMINALDMYCAQLKRNKGIGATASLNHFVVIFENPLLHSPEFMGVFSKFLQELTSIPLQRREVLVQWYSSYPTKDLERFVSSLQQFITLQLLLLAEDNHGYTSYVPQADLGVSSATSALMLFFFANLVSAKRANTMRPMSLNFSSIAAQRRPELVQTNDSDYHKLLTRLQLHPANAVSIPIPMSEFINEQLNSVVSMSVDYRREAQSGLNEEKEFSFLEHPFILNTEKKVEKLFRDNLFRMVSERHRTLFHSVLTGVPDTPFLLLRIERNNFLMDTLVQLEAIADLNPIDLRKQLRVVFRGEEGVDEGGLQKELFQLLVETLFNPKYGMFLYDEEYHHHLFNPASYETEEQYKLIGLLLGLAIYNSIILDIRFPMVVYRKLIGCETVFEDLYSSHPQIASSLKQMLEYKPEENVGLSLNDTFMATFQVSYSDMFGNVCSHSLKEDGDSIDVTEENREEYVSLYTDWLLNTSIAKSFDAFKHGFDLVMGDSCLADLFVAEEVEMLVCGCNEWDLDALEASTRYDGFTRHHPVIVNFWQIVREFDDKQKKQLLAFITGSDRIPLGGLSKLKFIIVKNGPDSDRLPTAHTCFNALLLCAYSTKEKLRERLLKALTHGKGFGMI